MDSSNLNGVPPFSSPVFQAVESSWPAGLMQWFLSSLEGAPGWIGKTAKAPSCRLPFSFLHSSHLLHFARPILSTSARTSRPSSVSLFDDVDSPAAAPADDQDACVLGVTQKLKIETEEIEFVFPTDQRLTAVSGAKSAATSPCRPPATLATR